MRRSSTSHRHIKLLLAALLTSLVSTVAQAGSGSCPTASTTISSNVTATCTLNTNDSLTIDSGGGIVWTGNQWGKFGITIWSGETDISITNNGSISIADTGGNAPKGIIVYGSVASLNNSGSITASSSWIAYGIQVNYDGSITTLTNSGSISHIRVEGDNGFGTPGTITTLNNGGTITTLDIAEEDPGFSGAGIVTTLNNSGTISSAVAMGAGTLNLTGTAGSITGDVTGTGAVNVSGTFTSGNTFSSGTFAIASGGVFTQGHTVTTTGGFSNAGTHVVAAGTTANVTGNYSPANAGTFRSNVTNSTTFGKLAVSGTASLPATMNINIVTGNNCAGVSSGQTLASVISAGTLTENSTTYTVTDDCSGLNFTATKNGNAIDITAASAASAPTATTSAANSVGQTGATLNGTINDNGASTTVTFDYGTTNAYGTNVAATTGGTVNAGSGSTAVAVTLTGLTCNTAYNFRVTGVNSAGTTNGSDATFTTSACSVNGACGSSNSSSVTSAPSTNLCTTGTASAVSGSGPWSWSCTGSNGGSTANCSASVYAEPPPPPPPPITLPTGGGTGTVTTGGNTIVVTNNGSTGTTINLGGSGSGTNSNTVQLPGTGSVTVTNTGSATLSVGTSGSNSVLNVTSGSATVTASGSGQPLAMGNGLILVTANNSGASATVSASGSSAPVVNTGGNTTVTILGTPAEVAGASLQLVGSGNGGAPVTFQAAAGATPITLQPGSAGTVFTVQPVTGASGSQTSALVVSWGSVSITVPGSGSTGIAAGNQAVTGSAGSSLVVSGLAGQQQVWVTGGTVTLPTPSAQATARLERSSRIVSTDRLPSGTLYAGETAIIDADGNVTAAYIGSPSANQGLTGDRLDMPVIAGLSIDRAGTRISGTTTRLGADLETTIFDVLQSHGFSRSNNSADSLGAFDFAGAGEHGAMHTFRGMVSGRVSIDHRQADGFAFAGNGGIAMTRGGVSVTLVPAVANLEAFAAAVKSLDGCLSLNLHTDGSFLAHFSGARRYALQPGYEVADTDGAAGFGSGPAGGYITYTDPQGRKQAFYPAAADFATLLTELQKADAAASLTGDAAGTLMLTLGNRSMRLKPDFELIDVPQDKIGQPWWIGADGKFYVQVKNVFAYRGVAQGFAVE